MGHAQFVAAYRSGALRVHIDKTAAARFVSARLLLPLVRLPVLGIGVALALTGSVWAGLIVLGIGTLLPFLVKRSAPHFVITQSLQDAEFYEEAVKRELLQIIEK